MIIVLMLLSGAFIFLATDDVSASQSGDYTYTQSAGQATITAYTGHGGAITIPSTLDGYPVVSIDPFAFSDNRNITSVIIPNSVTAIYGYAFGWCSVLTSVTIGSGVTYLGDYAFYACQALTSITIPSSVTLIGPEPFEFCRALTAINVAAANPNYASVDGILYNKAITELIQCPGGKTGSVAIPGSVTTIDDDAFQSCEALTSVTIPSSVTSIGSRVFLLCTAMTAINVAAANSKFASIDGVLYNKTFTELIQYPIGKTGTLTIPDGVISIHQFAFYECEHLTAVTISNSVTTIGDYAFDYCANLTSVIVGSGVTKIGMYAFHSCSALTSMTLPSSVMTISDYAFWECSSLTAFNVASSNPNFASVDGVLYNKTLTTLIQYPIARAGAFSVPNNVTSLKFCSFYLATHLTSLIICDSVTKIEFSAFYHCSNLTSVVIGDGVTIIESSAFSNCEKLSSVMLGDNVTTLTGYTFYSCPSLTSITLPESVITIGDGTFYLTDLTSIVIPSGVTTIGYSAFNSCVNLTSIIFLGLGAPTTVGNYWIFNTSAGIVGHAYAASNFPASGNSFHGLIMGAVLSTVPGAPTGLAATSGNAQVVITWATPAWSGASAVTHYKLYRSATSNGTYTQVSSPSGLTYTDTNLTNGQVYWYKISAVNANGEGNLSAAISVTPSTVPSAPQGPSVTYDDGKGNITWQVPTSNGGNAITEYKVYRSTTSNGTYVLIATQAGLNFKDTGLTKGQTYWYKVSAVNANGEGGLSSAVSIDVPKSSASSNDNTMLIVGVVIAIVLVGIVAFLFMRRKK